MDAQDDSEYTVVTLRLTHKEVKTLRRIAADWGLLIERGTGSGQGNISKLAKKLASGDMIVVSQRPRSY